LRKDLSIHARGEGKKRIIAPSSSVPCVEMREGQQGFAVQCAGEAHRASIKRAEADDIVIYQ
jgi:hypothetical protein